MNSTSTIHPRRSDCPGSFHSAQSMRTVFRLFPYYGKHFTQIPSLQSRLFLIRNSLCLIFKVLPILGFCFTTDVRILASHSYALTRSYNEQNPCYMKTRKAPARKPLNSIQGNGRVLYQKCKARDQKVIAVSLREALRVRFHPDIRAIAQNAGLPTRKLNKTIKHLDRP